jgi:hypothetical protein
MTAMPASAMALAAATRDPPPPSIFTASIPPSFSNRVALSTAYPTIIFSFSLAITVKWSKNLFISQILTITTQDITE